MSKPIELNQEEMKMLFKYVACRTILEKYDQLSEADRDLMLVKAHGIEMTNKQGLYDQMVEFQAAIAKSPRLQQALSEREWYLVEKGFSYSLEYKRTISEKSETGLQNGVALIEGTTQGMIELFQNKEFRLVAGGLLAGALVVLGILKPMLLYKLFIFAFVTGLVGFFGLGGVIYLLEHLGVFKNSKEPWTTGKSVLCICLVLLVLGIAIFIGVQMAGDVRQGNFNPYDDREQTYPY